MNDLDKIWVFLSHSNKDFDTVRKVRNALEEKGFRPIMFFLKCMEDEKQVKALSALINDEIDHRNRFIYCKSPNAEQSPWVKAEIEHLIATNRKYEIIDLQSSDTTIKEFAEDYKNNATIFLPYARKNQKLADSIVFRLRKYGLFDIYPNDGSIACKREINLCTSIDQIIDSAKEKGWLIFLLSENEIDSAYCRAELSYALRNKNSQRIIPIAFSNEIAERLTSLPEYSSIQKQIAIIQSSNIEDEIIEIILSRMISPGDILAYANQSGKGKGRAKNTQEANNLYRLFFKLAEQSSNPTALQSVARCYEFGYGVNKDLNEAYNLYCECRANGLPVDEDCRRVYNKLQRTK